MTNDEFSNEFDILTDRILSSKEDITLKFNEYDKSVFLTKAQDMVAISLYNGTLLGKSFEETEELRKYLAPLVKASTCEVYDKDISKLSESLSVVYKLPEDTLFVIYDSLESSDERLGCNKGTTIEVVPVLHDEYHRISKNPFKGPSKKRALRLDIGDNLVEVIYGYTQSKYNVRYLSKPSPIILVDLPDNLTIDKISKATECKLHPALHRTILEMAVKIAIQSRGSAK